MQTAISQRREHTHNPWLVLAIVCLAQFMVVLDATVVNVALPTIQKDLNFTDSSLQWVVNAYTLLFGGFLLLGGRAADLFGRRRLFMGGVVLFTGASILNGLAPSSEFLIISRALQGLGGAMVSPAALSIVTTTFSEGRERARAMSVWAAIAVGGGAFGLIAGGILTEYATWRWIFFVNVPIGVITLIAAWRVVQNSHGTLHHRHFDLGGAISITSGLVILVFGIVKAQEFGWTSGKTIGLLAVALGLIGAFIAIERRSKAPLVRLGIFRIRTLSVGNAVLFVVSGGMFAVFFFETLYVQGILHLSPVQAGLGFLPLTAAIIGASAVAQQVIARFGVRAVAITGMTVGALGLVLLSRAPVDGTYVANVLPGLVVMGLGLGFTFVPMTLIATTNVANDDAGLASGLFNTSQQIGGALGLAILSTIAANRTTDHLSTLGHVPSPADLTDAVVTGYHAGFIAGAGMLVLGVVMAAAFLRNRDLEAINRMSPDTELPAPGHESARDLQPVFEAGQEG
jgi:EmrB/QacA subfamily drug resistance transporter